MKRIVSLIILGLVIGAVFISGGYVGEKVAYQLPVTESEIGMVCVEFATEADREKTQIDNGIVFDSEQAFRNFAYLDCHQAISSALMEQILMEHARNDVGF